MIVHSLPKKMAFDCDLWSVYDGYATWMSHFFFWGDNLMENKAIFNIFPMNNETFDYDSRLFIISLWWLFAHIGKNDDKPMDLLGLYRCVWLFSRENMENYDEPLLFGGWYYIYIWMVCPILDSHGRAEAPTIKASASSTCQAFCDEIGQGGAPFGGPGPGPRDATRYTRYDLRLEP